MRDVDGGLVALGLFYIAFAAVAAIGWVLNVVALVGMVSDPLSTAVTVGAVLRVLGIFFLPLGAIMGYFG